MKPRRQAVYVFSCDPARDPVAHRVFDAVRRLQPTEATDIAAAEVLAQSLTRVFGEQDAAARSLLCVGSAHFEPAFSAAVLNREHPPPLAVSHILANQWLGAGAYDSEAGYARLEACVRSIRGGLHAIVFHDGIRGRYKGQLRRLEEQLGIPVFQHQALRELEDLPRPGNAAGYPRSGWMQPLSR